MNATMSAGILRGRLRRAVWAAGLLALAVHMPRSTAQSADPGTFRLVGMSVGGGGVSTGATHRVVGAIVAMGSSSAQESGGLPVGGYQVSGALLGGLLLRSPEVRISVSRRTDGRFELSWPEAPGYVLETSPAVWPRTDWTQVAPQPADRVLVVTPSELVRYYRLRKL